nr:hypothetical protein Iba_chr01cCG3220 [Ipomoea batatas]GMD83532.1 hypothetical protein Iba_chr14aCG6000 [Ipomoea batatas]GMD93451.1 hypothetical protein Iba_chr14fCG7570 [Ipomoea batatas]
MALPSPQGLHQRTRNVVLHYSRLQFHWSAEEFGGTNLIETLFTQWRSSVGVLNPSPLKTWPRCPPQAVQVISVLLPSGSG